MSRLDDFLGLADVSDVRETITVKVDGKQLELVIRPLSEDEHNEFQTRSRNISKNKVSFDMKKYNDLVLSACIVEPNFSDENFLRKAKCVSGIEFLSKKFAAGTLADIADKIQKLSGFDSLDMEIEAAKN